MFFKPKLASPPENDELVLILETADLDALQEEYNSPATYNLPDTTSSKPVTKAKPPKTPKKKEYVSNLLKALKSK